MKKYKENEFYKEDGYPVESYRYFRYHFIVKTDEQSVVQYGDDYDEFKQAHVSAIKKELDMN
jgi:hypothetical protein